MCTRVSLSLSLSLIFYQVKRRFSFLVYFLLFTLAQQKNDMSHTFQVGFLIEKWLIEAVAGNAFISINVYGAGEHNYWITIFDVQQIVGMEKYWHKPTKGYVFQLTDVANLTFVAKDQAEEFEIALENAILTASVKGASKLLSDFINPEKKRIVWTSKEIKTT